MTYYTYSVKSPFLKRKLYMIRNGLIDGRCWTPDKRELSRERLHNTPRMAKYELQWMLKTVPGWNYGEYKLEKIFIGGLLP